MRPTSYETLVSDLCTSTHLCRYRRLFNSFPGLDGDQRSAIAKLCRAQCYPLRTSRLAKMTDSLPQSFIHDILPLCQTPLLAGLVLQLILQAPMSQREIERTYTASLIKEVRVMESAKRECTLNFEPFFGDFTSAIHPMIPPNPRVARLINDRINQWIDRLTDKVLFPRVGSKTVSKMTAAEIQATFPTYDRHNAIGITPIDLERVYHYYRYHATGPCEMRQKWYTSNLQPRTYYAQGGDAFHSSKYLAVPLVDLCDTLPATNRRTRVDPGRIVIREPSHDVAYYDLTSFTSNLHVHTAFMSRLAHYAKGHTVKLLDSVYGIIEADLGDLIHEYTLINLHNPSYTLPPTYSDRSVLHYHSIAGFLGVYGNISSATFIHGIVMTMLHRYLDEGNVAGDDGLDVTPSVEYTLDVVGLLGEVADAKTFRDSEGSCIHLKRPILRIGNRLLHGQLITWPSLEPVQNTIDGRYPYLQGMSHRERIDTLANSITAFLRKLECQNLTDEQLDITDTFLSSLYNRYGLPKAGCVPQITQSNLGFVPMYERRFIGMDPIKNTIERHYANIAKLPLRGYIDWDGNVLKESVFQCNQNKLVRHLEILGYLHQQKESIYVYGQEGLELLLNEYLCPEPPIYTYTVVCDLPVWVVDTMLANSI